ncbi:MAG: YdcF family protein [Labilithrix sp.]|nr:YdcF family protein [Labilithrix sp.]
MNAVVCVLGCRPGSAALARRARVARDVFVARGARWIMACGGRSFRGRVEADELARMLEDGGVPAEAILRERASRDTFENATEAARLLAERDLHEAVVVTCSWHLPRATTLFERAGLRVAGAVGAPPPDPTLLSRAWWAARERVSLWKDSLR